MLMLLLQSIYNINNEKKGVRCDEEAVHSVKEDSLGC